MSTRRAKGWWKWYWNALEVHARRAFDTVMVVSDGDVSLANQARRDERLRHYWHEAGQNDKGQEVFFCWTLRKDASGHYRTWREVHTQTAIKRYDVVYKRTKAQAAEVARKRYNVFIGADENDDAPEPVDFIGTPENIVSEQTPDDVLRGWLDKEWR